MKTVLHTNPFIKPLRPVASFVLLCYCLFFLCANDFVATHIFSKTIDKVWGTDFSGEENSNGSDEDSFFDACKKISNNFQMDSFFVRANDCLLLKKVPVLDNSDKLYCIHIDIITPPPDCLYFISCIV